MNRPLASTHHAPAPSRPRSAALWLALAWLAGSGCGSGSAPTDAINIFISNGTVSNLFVGSTDIFGTTITGAGDPYLGAAYLIGSCSAVDDGNNVTTRTFDTPTPMPLGGSVTFSGQMRTINGSTSCTGPDYTWTLTRPDNRTLHSVVDVFNVRSVLRSLSMPSDFLKDPRNRFVYGRSGFSKTIDGCRTQSVDGNGLFYQELTPSCSNGAGIFVGFAIQAPPAPFVEWRNERLGIGLRRTILGGNYKHITVFSAPGADNLQPSWDDGPIRPGARLHAEEDWTIFDF